MSKDNLFICMVAILSVLLAAFAIFFLTTNAINSKEIAILEEKVGALEDVVFNHTLYKHIEKEVMGGEK